MPIFQLSFSLIVVSNLVASSAAMVRVACWRTVSEGLFVSCLIFPAAGERVGQSFQAVSVEKQPCIDGFVVDWYVPGSVSGHGGWYLIFTASAAAHTWFHVKTCFHSVAVASHMPCDENSYCNLCEHTFTLARTSHVL